MFNEIAREYFDNEVERLGNRFGGSKKERFHMALAIQRADFKKFVEEVMVEIRAMAEKKYE